MLKTYFFISTFLIVGLGGCNGGTKQQTGELQLVNLSHLNTLYEEVSINDQPMAIIHIYSEYPDYKWVDANNEGIACVDDAARAAIVYLRHYEITGDKGSLQRARRLIDFCRYMQADDGLFYNFIYADYAINKTGKTSLKSFDWWTARGIWVLGEGYRVFRDIDQEYADVLQNHIQKIFSHIEELLQNYPEVENNNGFKVPKWLVQNCAADATSELMLGLAAYAQASSDTIVINYLSKFAEALIQMQIGDEQNLPYGALLSWQNVWHGWGNSQTQALAEASKVVTDPQIISAAAKEAKYFYPFWIKQGFPREIIFSKNGTFEIKEQKKFDQIAYAFRPTIVGALTLFGVTGDTVYAELAGELASWFLGNNPAGVNMYNPETGLCFDGILSEKEINRNSGAESTIEALYSLIEIENNKIALNKLRSYLTLK